MANQLKELRRLIQEDDRSTGTIISIEGSAARIRTSRGVVMATLPSTTFQVGQTVRIQGEAVLGRVKALDDLPVYNL